MKTLPWAKIALVKRVLALAGAAVLLGLAGEARGQSTEWTGNATSDWNDSGSWDPAVPTSSYQTYIDTNGTVQPILNGVTGTTDSLYVGETGSSGTNTLLTLEGGAVLTVGFGFDVGDESDATGAVTMAGAGTEMYLTQGGAVGLNGVGLLTVGSGSTVDGGNNNFALGASAGRSGTVVVDGGTLGNLSELDVGEGGNGTLTVTDGGNVSAMDVYLATGNQFVTDVLTVTGTNSTLASAGYLVVGAGGTGEMDILNGGNVTAAVVSIADSPMGSGCVTVDGANSTLTVTGGLNVGNASFGSLTISGGGAVRAGLLSIAENMYASASVDVTGTNSTLTVDGAEVGAFETGILSVENGGTVTVTPGNSMELGVSLGSAGAVDVGGGGTLQVGGANGITGGSGEVSFNLLGGTVQVIGSDFSTAVAATLVTSTTSILDTNGFNASWDGIISGAGNLTKAGVGTLTLSGVNGYTGLTTVSAGRLDVTGSLVGEMLVCSGATLGGNGSVGNSVTLSNEANIVPGFGGPSLTVENLTWGGSTGSNATAYFTLSNVDNTASLLTILGNFAKGTGTTFKFDFGGTGNGTTSSPVIYTLISFGTLFDAGNGVFLISDFSYQNLGGVGTDGTFEYSGNNLTFTVVPEPGLAAVAAGLVGLGLAGWRRGKRS
jgi:T5SS/PEP-CTERM-associated repeat protein/autotransporter-associated beta strand protein